MVIKVDEPPVEGVDIETPTIENPKHINGTDNGEHSSSGSEDENEHNGDDIEMEEAEEALMF